MEHQPESPESHRSAIGRWKIVMLAAAIAIAAGGLAEHISSSQADGQRSNNVHVATTENTMLDQFTEQVGASLINLHETSHGGWRFKSEIQAPHYQTDRDVGAASVGMGFLALADKYPRDVRWIDAAKHTATWLEAVSSQDGHGGRYWHDFVDDHEVSTDVYTSFDDGAIGIGDFFWQLYEKTKDPQYKKIALETLQWTFSQAQSFSENGIKGYRWKWDVGQNNSPYYMGMGEGQAGIITALASYYERLKTTDPKIAAECKQYIDGGLSGIGAVRKELGINIGTSRTIPETGVVGQDGDTALNSGYLSGAAGAAYMYLKLHQVFNDDKYLAKASEVLGWLSDTKNGPMVKLGQNSVAWQLELDPQGGNNNRLATGVEEGNAGIGWTYLQAYKQTGNETYLSTAKAAGNWLLSVAVKDKSGGLAWHEDERPTNPLFHPNLDNGAAGIGMFLRDLYLASGDKSYKAGAEGALKWLMNSAKHQDKNIYWQDWDGDKSHPFSEDPSWHWGAAGEIEFFQRMLGGKQDIPGEQPGITAGNKH